MTRLKSHAKSVEMFRQSTALDDGLYGAFPDYVERPFEWERRMRMIMAGTLKHNGILSGFTQDNLLKSTLEQASASEVIGNRRKTLRVFGAVCRDYARRKKADATELMIEREEIFEYGKQIGLTEAEVSGVIVKTHHGNDYVKRCKIGLDWHLKTHPRSAPDQIAVQNAQSLAEFAAITEDRNVDDDATVALNARLNELAAEQSGDELTAPVWSAASLEGVAAEKAAFKHFSREFLIIRPNAQPADHLLKAMDNVPLGVYIAELGPKAACEKLQAYLDVLMELKEQENGTDGLQNDSPAIGVHEMQPDATSAPNSTVNPASNIDLPEAPFSANFHLWNKHGVDVQFTIRSETVNEGCKKVDTTIENRIAAGYTVSRPQAQAAQALPSNITQMTPVAPAPAPTTQPSAGSGSYPIAEVKKIVDEGKTRIELFSHAGDEGPAGAVRTAGDIAKLQAAGVAVDQLAIGTRYAVALEADWKDGKMNPKNGKPYRDIIAIRRTA